MTKKYQANLDIQYRKSKEKLKWQLMILLLLHKLLLVFSELVFMT